MWHLLLICILTSGGKMGLLVVGMGVVFPPSVVGVAWAACPSGGDVHGCRVCQKIFNSLFANLLEKKIMLKTQTSFLALQLP